MQTIQAEITKWAKETFPNETNESKILHMFEEVEEAFAELWEQPIEFLGFQATEVRKKTLAEIADIGMILLNHASDFGVTVPVKNSVLVKMMREKLEVNKHRSWGTGADGVCRHIKEQVQ
jgi:hypothetical protein